MTTQTVQARTTTSPLMRIAAAVALVTLAMDAFGVWGYGTADDDAALQMLVTGAFTVVSVAVVFGLVLPRALRSDNPGRTGLILSVLGLLVSVPLFWSGLAPALAVGGIVAGRAGTTASRGRRLGTAAFVVGILAVIGYVGTYAGDWLSHVL
jgi:hypothetical protein